MHRLPKADYVAENGYRIVRAIVGGQTSSAAQITCHDCDFTDTVALPRHLPANAVHEKFTQRGWNMRKPKKPVCARCQAINAAARKQPPKPEIISLGTQYQAFDIRPPVAPQILKEEPPMSSSPAPHLAAVSPAVLPAALMRRVFGMLEEQFDVPAGRYAAGWSDRKVSETVNVPMAQVTRIREEAFGPIKADAEMQGMQAEQARIGKAIEKLLDDHVAVGRRMEAYALKMGIK